MELHGEYIREWLLLLLLLLLGELHGDCIREWLFMNGRSRLDLDAPGSSRPGIEMLFFSSIKRSSVYPGLLHTYPATFPSFGIWSNPA